ncbi:MAG: IS1634 family transposase [Candidatus Methanofastidiosa archaeon]|nr:IS1634 family transposase [Candidatus Methanofastidiosa archaeon]
MGKLEGIDSKRDRKLLADRIEQLIKGEKQLFYFSENADIERFAQEFAGRIIDEQLIDVEPCLIASKQTIDVEKDYQTVDLNSFEHEEAREIGAEWLCKQTVDQLGLKKFLTTDCSFSETSAGFSLMHLVSRAVYPASENKTAQWIKDNSAISGLFNIPLHQVNRSKLYAASNNLYAQKKGIEKYLSRKTNDLFDLQDKIIFYDLTNTYFEGRKVKSKKAKFGRGKQKRSDAKIIALAAVINAEGFLKYSRIYEGNISDSDTLEQTIEDLATGTSASGRKPLVVIDAGILTEGNSLMLKQKGYDYIGVSRTKLKDYTAKETDGENTKIYDKRKNPIELRLVTKPGCADTYMYVKSKQKGLKEASMNDHFCERYELELNNIQAALSKKGGTKKYAKVCERIGRLKERYPTANKHYSIEVKPDEKQDKAIDVIWKRTPLKPKSSEGIYFIRTSLSRTDEKTLWTIYNTLTEIEATFRILKTDLSLRPVFHKTDENVESHLFLGVLAYQVVASIRYQLKQKKITHDWRNIVRIMNTQKEITTTMKNKKGGTILIKKCSTPIIEARRIYDALNYKHNPYFMRKSVVPE